MSPRKEAEEPSCALAGDTFFNSVTIKNRFLCIFPVAHTESRMARRTRRPSGSESLSSFLSLINAIVPLPQISSSSSFMDNNYFENAIRCVAKEHSFFPFPKRFVWGARKLKSRLRTVDSAAEIRKRASSVHNVLVSSSSVCYSLFNLIIG